MWRTRAVVVGMLVLVAACQTAPAEDANLVPGLMATTTTAAILAPPPPPPSPPPPSAAPVTLPPVTTTAVRTTRATTAPTVAPTTQPRPRIVHEQAWTPFASAGEGQVVLHHPASRVERVGFHESNHDGARSLDPSPSAVSPITLEGRDRGTGERTAADVVVDPASEIRAPVTGRVKRAGTYILYCDNRDDYVVIEPDAHPGWEVKLLHINGVRVRAGDRVVAGETVLAPRAAVLPFASQVEEVSATPPWPHVHIEVVDPTIPDRPSGPGC